jgi:hypothetical protein
LRLVETCERPASKGLRITPVQLETRTCKHESNSVAASLRRRVGAWEKLNEFSSDITLPSLRKSCPFVHPDKVIAHWQCIATYECICANCDRKFLDVCRANKSLKQDLYRRMKCRQTLCPTHASSPLSLWENFLICCSNTAQVAFRPPRFSMLLEKKKHTPRTHTHTHTHTHSRTPFNEWSANRRGHHQFSTITRKNIHVISEIQTRRPSNRAVVYLCLRPHRHWERLRDK